MREQLSPRLSLQLPHMLLPAMAGLKTKSGLSPHMAEGPRVQSSLGVRRSRGNGLKCFSLVSQLPSASPVDLQPNLSSTVTSLNGAQTSVKSGSKRPSRTACRPPRTKSSSPWHSPLSPVAGKQVWGSGKAEEVGGSLFLGTRRLSPGLRARHPVSAFNLLTGGP